MKKQLILLLAILLGVGSVVCGIMMLANGSVIPGVLVIVLGIVAALLIYFLLHIGIVTFENISVIARGVETQHRIATAQLEVLSSINLAQSESLRLEKQSVELLKVIDGDRFDAAKQAECQTALLDKLTEQQREQAQRMSELTNSSDAMMQLTAPLAQSLQSWKNESHRFIQGVALAISQLPDRIRDAIAGEKNTGHDDLRASDDAPAGEAVGNAASSEPENTSEQQ